MNYKDLKKEFYKKAVMIERQDALKKAADIRAASLPKTTGNLTSTTWAAYNRK